MKRCKKIFFLKKEFNTLFFLSQQTGRHAVWYGLFLNFQYKRMRIFNIKCLTDGKKNESKQIKMLKIKEGHKLYRR